MAEISLKIQNKEGKTLCVSSGEDFVSLVHTAEYQEGDYIAFETSEKNIHIFLQVDDALGQSFCYVTDNVYYHIPFGEKRISYSPKAFCGNRHYLCARVAREDEVKAYRNLALNVNDQHGDTHCYPHASANVETRGRLYLQQEMPLMGYVRTVPTANGHMNPGALIEIRMRK